MFWAKNYANDSKYVFRRANKVHTLFIPTFETVKVSQDFSKWIVWTNDVERFREISWVEVENKKSNIKTIPT